MNYMEIKNSLDQNMNLKRNYEQQKMKAMAKAEVLKDELDKNTIILNEKREMLKVLLLKEGYLQSENEEITVEKLNGILIDVHKKIEEQNIEYNTLIEGLNRIEK